MAIFPDLIPVTMPPRYPDLFEVVNGEIKELNVGARQATLAFRLATFLEIFAKPKQLGQAVTEALFHLLDGNPERRPDVAFISAQRWQFDLEGPQENAWPVVPDLAAEIISPSNTYNEIQQKKEEYFQAGVIVIWVVNTELRKIEVFDNRGGDHESADGRLAERRTGASWVRTALERSLLKTVSINSPL